MPCAKGMTFSQLSMLLAAQHQRRTTPALSALSRPGASRQRGYSSPANCSVSQLANRRERQRWRSRFQAKVKLSGFQGGNTMSTHVEPGPRMPLVGSAVLAALAENWWLLLLRGLVSIAFGLIAFFWP